MTNAILKRKVFKAKNVIYDDGGRSKYFQLKQLSIPQRVLLQGSVGDRVTRAIAIAADLPYESIYDRLAESRDGISTTRKWLKDYMVELGFEWTPTMQIGSGCQVHLRSDELPSGRLVCEVKPLRGNVSRSMVAVIDGVVHDTYDSSRDGTRCVYGYWKIVN